jgi:hypothetical protein
VARALNSLLAVGASATLIAGCGGSDGGDAPLVKPQVLLESAAAHPVRSADVRGQARLTLNGSSVLAQPVTMRVEGPYVSGGGVRIPSFDWKFGVKVLGFGVGGKLVSNGQNVFLSPFGDNYEFGEPAIAAVNRQLSGSSPPARELLGVARNEGNEEVDGTDTQHVNARLDGRAVAAAFEPWRDQLGLSHVPAPVGRIGVWIGLEDRTVHKLTLDADFEIAPADRPRFGGASGGNLRVEAELDEINEPQTIQVPGGGGYKPVGDLLLTLQDLGAFAP